MNKDTCNKKKVAILTWCDNNGPTNYGQILQCYAMQYLVRKKGYEPVVVQYRKKDKRDLLKHNFSNRTILGRFLNHKYENYYNLKVIEGEKTVRVKRFKEFIKKYIPLSPPCYTKNMVEEITKDCEILICGSDQIWNPIWFDPIWFLDFGTEKQRRIAYAPSGIFHETPEFIEYYKKMVPFIEKMDQVSIREQVGANILKKYVKKEIKVKKDPTLCLDNIQWDQVAAKRLIEEDYVLCYIMGSISPHLLILRALKEKYQVENVIYIPTNMRKEKGYVEFVKYEEGGPAEFLSLVKYAKAVCTDSFHGTVMAIQYRIPFYNVYRAHKGTEAFGGRERIENLMEVLGLESHWVRNVKEVRKI